jgi:HD-GYP domain-containing protein (c-di-GMP phosphodiesterase class II)
MRSETQGMATTQDLLGVISALRQRLDRAQSLVQGAGAAMTSTLGGANQATLENLKKKIAEGLQDQQQLHHALTQVYRSDSGHNLAELPPHLTSRAAHLLAQTRDLLLQLKQHSCNSVMRDEHHPAALHYQDSVLLTDLVLRCLQTLPDKPSLQLRFCSGVDVLLGIIRERLAILEILIRRHVQTEQQLEELSNLLQELHHGTLGTLDSLFALAENIIQESNAGQGLHFLSRSWEQPEQYVAAHCLSTARVLARIAGADAHWRGNLLHSVAAALVHDVGMLTLPVDVLCRHESLDEEQLATIERHCKAGANTLEDLGRGQPWLVDAVLHHHERLDGTGYPSGLKDKQIKPLVRLLAVCDVYAALCCPRPHRTGMDTREALRETLHLARNGLLDRDCARLLLRLSFYPAGTAVELNDGSCGVVIGEEKLTEEDGRPARPVVVVLTTPSGETLADPQWLDLGTVPGCHVRRSLSAEECSKHFGQQYPQFLYT